MGEPITAPSVIAPGNHDGVHRGHRALLAAARARAARDGLRVVAMFFDPRPVDLLAPERAEPLLTTPARRAELLLAAGADDVAVRAFDRPFSQRSPEEFARDVLVRDHGARGVVVGPDFKFGRGRAGDVSTLVALGEKHGFDVTVVEQIASDDGERVSTTRVRRLLQAGDPAGAARLLERVHDVDGLVIEGDRRGRTIGFPTANVAHDQVVVPADGVYAVVVRRIDAPGALLHGAANLGVRPTVGAGRSLEVHLLDFDEEIYGARLRIGFVARLRGEQKFDGLDALKAQIARDVEAARSALHSVDQELLRWV